MKRFFKIASFLAPFLVLIAVTIFLICSERKEVSSLFLTQERTEEEKAEGGKTVRIDYVDENGKITYASDVGYATIIRTYENDRLVLEEYFDEHGKPTALWNGAYAVTYDYNDQGQAEWIRYLDSTGNPTVIYYGYTSIHRTYNENGFANTDTYYNGDQQVRCNNEYYAYERTSYDEKNRPGELIYLDQDGQPYMVMAGYAKIKREYYDDGWYVKREFYFDADGDPCASEAGYYGCYYEYDDNKNQSMITYLDADGNPVNNNAGYATTKFMYDDHSVKQFFYDRDGNPATGGQNQYGTETIGTNTYYLNSDGSRMFRVDNLVENSLLLVLFFGTAMAVLAVFLHKKGRLVLLIISLAIIIIMTLRFREVGMTTQQIHTFGSFKRMFTSRETMTEIINNIWLFVPFGAALYKCGSKRWLFPILVSVLVEVIQLVFGMGFFEIEDIICNSIGGLIGYNLVRGSSSSYLNYQHI